MSNVSNFVLVIGLLVLAGLGCADRNTTNRPMNANAASTPTMTPGPAPSQIAEPTFKIPVGSVPATEITRDFDNSRNDLQAAIKKWRNTRVTFHGTVYTVEKEDNGKYDISLAGHDGMFTVFCDDIPASQAKLVARLKEDKTVIAINGVILGNGITGLVPGRVDHDVKAQKCKIVE